MMKRFSKIVIGVSIGVSCYTAGTYFEKRRLISELKNVYPDVENYQRYSKYPIFPQVYAATAIAPYSQPANIVSLGERTRQIMKYGYPTMDPETVKSQEDYVLCYDRRNRVAHWVLEHLTKESVQHNDEVDRSKCNFTVDERIHPYFRSENSDYKKTGYDRGHLAAAGNHRKCQKHCEETFLLSNMAPQVGKGFNRDSWNRLEKHVRKLTKVYPNVYVCTGPLYLPKREADGKSYVKYEVIGANNVAVPTHFFKVVVGETNNGGLEMEAYVMPNEPISDTTPLTMFQVPPESIERAAGLLLFNKVTTGKFLKINGKQR